MLKKLFDETVLSNLLNVGFEPVLPLELKSNRSVIVHSVDREILIHEVGAIKHEVQKCNDYGEPLEVIKLGKSNKIKIVFISSVMADLCIARGLSLFYLHIPADSIERDKFIQLITCFNCYAVEKHSTQNCPRKSQNPDYLVCSKCAQENHTHKNCKAKNEEIKCINCRLAHESISMSCSIRKDALKARRSKPAKSFSVVTKELSRPVSLSKDMINTSVSLTLLALLKNEDTPGCFSDVFNDLMRKNNLPTLNLEGFEPPSLYSIQKLVCKSNQANNTQSSNSDQITSSESSNVSSHDIDEVATVLQEIPDMYTRNQVETTWNEMEAIKTTRVKVKTTDDLRSALNNGEALIISTQGSHLSDTVIKAALSSKTLPPIRNVKMDEFKKARSINASYGKKS